MTLTTRIPKDLEKRLEELSIKTGSSKSELVRKALELFLLRDEDYLLALQRLAENNPRVSLEEIKKLVDEQ